MKQLAIYLLFIGLQVILYHAVGFELAVIFLLAQAVYFLAGMKTEPETIEERWKRK